MQRAITFGESDLRILKEISDLLSTEEKQQLYDEYVWPKDDWLTVQMQQKQSIFLACLFCKAMETTDSNDLGMFFDNFLNIDDYLTNYFYFLSP